MASHSKPCLLLLRTLLAARRCLTPREQDSGTMELSPHEPKATPTENCISFFMPHEAILKNVLSLKAPQQA